MWENINAVKFINRHSEIRTLKAEYEREGSSFVVVYGRRRQGKTTLLSKFAKDYPNTIYYFADRESEAQQIEQFKNLVALKSGDGFMTDVVFGHWDKAIEYYVQRTDFTQKALLIIDEFQYLAMVNPAFPSMLQRYWDMILKHKNIMLILCGSSLSMLYSTVLSYNSPLYGRRTAQIHLKNIHFSYFGEFLPQLTDARRLVEFYAITSGVPKYIELLDKEADVYSNILKFYLTKDSFLYHDAKFLLIDEVREPVNYFSILKTIAAGNHKMADICNRMEVQSPKITPYLEALRELDLVERRVPITESHPEKSKRGLYFIKDQYMRFWFRYVFPFQSFLELGQTEWVMSKIRAEFDQYVSLIFEDICRSMIPVWFGAKYNQIGSHWESSLEIDIAAHSEDKKDILYGECKWREQPVGKDVLDELVEKVKAITPWHSNKKAKISYALFSKNGFTDELRKMASDKLILIDFSTLEVKTSEAIAIV